MTVIDLTRLMDIDFLPNTRGLRRYYYFYLPPLFNALFSKGAFEGKEVEKLMRRNLVKKGPDGKAKEITFGDLKQPKRESWESEYRLKVVATDVTRRRPVVFPDDAEDYREYPNKDDMRLGQAVRMSMSIPFVFKPVVLHERDSGARCFIVDGGVSSNFPIGLFDRPSSAVLPLRPTFGVLLDEGQELHRLATSLGPAFNTILTAMGAMDRRLSPWDEDRTVRISVPDVSSTNFGLSLAKQIALRNRGCEAMMTFLEEFDWRKYVLKYRTSPTVP